MTYGAQVPKQLYEFPDLEMDEVEVGKYPTGAEVQRYIERYADHFDLRDDIVLNTRVTNASQNEDGSWTVKTKSNDDEEEERQFDKLVVSTGLYSNDRPSLPDWASGGQANGLMH